MRHRRARPSALDPLPTRPRTHAGGARPTHAVVAREALAAGRVPAGAEPFVQWWRGDSQYEGGRGAAPAGLWTSKLPDDALRCVCEHLAPTSPNSEADHLVDESREYEEEFSELSACGADDLDEHASGLDGYSSDLLVQIRKEEACVGVAGQLRLVCSRWRHALKQNVVFLHSRLGEYREHQFMLSDNAAAARDTRIEVYGDPDDYFDDSDEFY